MPDLLQICPMTDEMRARLAEVFDITDLREHADTDGWLEQNGARFSHVLTDGHFGVKPAVMDRLPALRMISCYGVGYDNIDATAAHARDILVSHTPDVLNGEVANTTLLLILACYREMLRDDAWVRSGAWEAEGSAPLSRSVDNQTVGILGRGRIGQEIATRLAPFSPTVLYHTRSEKDVPYEYVGDLVEMARRADIVVRIPPGGAATRHFVNAQVVEALVPSRPLINVPRGSMVYVAAPTDALDSGRPGSAGLSVFGAHPLVS